MKKFILLIIIIIGIIFLVRILPTNGKKRFLKDLNSLKKAVEKEQKDEVLKYIDATYVDRNDMTYDRLIETIDDFFGQVDSIKIQMSGINVTIDSMTEEKTVFTSCSLGLKIFARYEGERVIAFGGLVKPAPIRAYFKKMDGHYRVYAAEY